MARPGPAQPVPHDATGDDGVRPRLAGLAVSCLGVQAIQQDRPLDARDLLDLATRIPARYGATSAILWMRYARAHAAVGDAADSERYLDIARTSLAAAAERPTWSYWIDETLIAAEEGRCWIDLRRPDRARPRLSAMVARADIGARDRVLYGAALAQAHLDDRQIDQACTQLDDTVSHLPAVPSRRCLELVASICNRLTSSRLTVDQQQTVTQAAVALRDRSARQ